MDTNLLFSLLSIGGLVLLSALLSAAETALLALTESKLKLLEEENGGKLSWSLRLWNDNPQRVLATIQVGDALADVSAIVLATLLSVEHLGVAGFGVVIPVMVVTTVIVGKALPKALAAHYADQLAVPSMQFLALLYLPLSLLSIPLSWLTRGVTFLAGRGAQESPPVTAEEIEYMIDLGAREGVIERNKGELLQSVLEFNDTVVREAMVPRTEVVALPLDTTPTDLIKTIISGGHSRVPIYEDTIDNIAGVLHTKDLFRVVHERGVEGVEIKPILRAPFYVPETMKVSKLLEEFRSKRSHLAVVVDEFGGTAGLITLEDVLEEIVGDIQDEYDVDEKFVTKLSTGRFSIDARISVNELEEQTGLQFPEDDGYDTLNGFLTGQAGKVPEVGTEITVAGLVIKVTESDGKRVARVEVRREVPPAQSE